MYQRRSEPYKKVTFYLAILKQAEAGSRLMTFRAIAFLK
ncbi:hypothetical protein XBFM1_1220003 [Xenorhabdus bovienii str. feltiae Moldova]|uniref:Uncharacterized protein n=1 Tax=Xenorhabdus bovienii str. feltiae Moldova TaxID=1398200 RepID=A0A077NQ84_XENBV|nr:hypothetical protein XBFM1_1220003 [Xenorhabdus bovienii str. feltiae Moldova]